MKAAAEKAEKARPAEVKPVAAVAPAPSGREDVERSRRARGRALAMRMAVFVLLPTVLASVYYGFVATDQFESYAQFSVHSVESPMGGKFDTMLFGLVGNSSRDTLVVRDHIQSRDMLARLDKEHGYVEHCKDKRIDWWTRLSADASFEDAYEHYLDTVEVDFDSNSSVLTLRVRATDPEKAKELAQSIIRYSEETVNQLSERERKDRTRFAEEQVKKSEERLTKARKALLAQQKKHADINPEMTAKSSMTVRTDLEAELAQARAHLMELKSYMTDEAPKVRAAKEKVKAISAQVDAEKKRLVTPEGKGGIAGSLAEFDAAMVEKEYADASYRSALATLEMAMADAARQHRYLAVVSAPSTPDESTYPRRALGVLTVFLLSFLIMSIGSLLVASVREHARI